MLADPRVQIFESIEVLARNAALELAAQVNSALGRHDRCVVALSGGETPRLAYRTLAMPKLQTLIEWNRVHLVFGDERLVPIGDPESNYGMVYDELISKLPIPRENVHAIDGTAEPTREALRYESEIRALFPDGDVRVDIALLGLGEDGHTASLFPGSEAVEERVALVRAVWAAHLQSWRISLTLPCINNARRIIFLVAGTRKKTIAQRIIRDRVCSAELPASLVKPAGGEILWMLDEEAWGEEE